MRGVQSGWGGDGGRCSVEWEKGGLDMGMCGMGRKHVGGEEVQDVQRCVGRVGGVVGGILW